MKHLVLSVTLCSILISYQYSYAQGVTIGSNNPADPAAVLELQSSSQGFLIARLTTAQRNAIINPPIGLQIYNTDTDCLELFFASGGWKPVQCGCTAFPNTIFAVSGASINTPVTFTAPAPNMTYSWTFQGGNPSNSTSQSQQVTWTNAGTYGITLTATDSAGCSSSHTDSIIVSSCQPLVYNFTPCGQTGMNGPSQNQCDIAYGAGVVSVNNGIQQWTVPATGTYRIQVAGAQGGDGYAISSSVQLAGETGAIVAADVTLTQGDVLHILVGQRGSLPSTTGTPGGGGGGSFVVRSGNPLMAAGGGTGNGNYGAAKGLTTTNGGNNGSGVLGGSNGSGGTGGTRGAGGGGFSGDGTNPTLVPYPSLPGFAFLNGGTGGTPANWGCTWTNGTGEGGFGGGASGGGACNPNGGAGGGYSGGAGGSNNVAGGGGSFIHPSAANAATSNGQYNNSSTHNGGPVQNINLYNSGHGYVTITRICP